MKRTLGQCIFISCVIFSCQDEPGKPQTSVHTTHILNYLNEVKSAASEENKIKIDWLITSLDFRHVYVEELSADEDVLIVRAPRLNGFDNKTVLKAVFFLNRGKIVRSHLIEFDQVTSNHNELAVSLFRNTFNATGYSGTVAYYSLMQDKLFATTVENGSLVANANANRRHTVHPHGRETGCTDWYLVTTYYYASGLKRTTEEYLYTTCDDGCTNTRVSGRLDCGGGSTGTTSQPSFPTNPQHGDEYEFRDPTGKIVVYRFDSTISTWTIAVIMLPEVVIQSNPQTYPYLLTESPIHNLVIFAPDNFAYTFNAYTGIWKGTPVGDRPLFEYSDKCQGLQNAWSNYPNNEVYGYITADGKFIVTNILSATGGSAFGTYSYNGTTYYPFPASQGAPTLSYAGMVETAGYYLIPVVASVHTHSPCRTDGSNGVSHPVGSDDKSFAASHPELNHWVIGCGAIGQYNGTDDSFSNVQSGNLSALCSSVH